METRIYFKTTAKIFECSWRGNGGNEWLVEGCRLNDASDVG